MKHFSHLNTAAAIIKKYNGNLPFQLFIKDFFKQDKKYGSRDRKQITHLCYCYFRLGQTVQNKPLPEAIAQALFLCADDTNEMLAAVQPAWNEKAGASIEEKCMLLNINPASLNIFSFPDELSSGIDTKDFNFSHLVQPDVFIRIRPGHHLSVKNKLEKAGIAFTTRHFDCISVAATTKIDELLQLNKEAVIQDYSSQGTGQLLQLVPLTGTGLSVWDCCAASGGKSIMAKDKLGDIDLTVSDIRPTVLANLKKRFGEAGIKNYTLLAADLSAPGKHLQTNSFDLIIADVPCTGSGTWGRTPERLSFFDEKETERYSQLQKKIVTTAISCLQNNGHFLYITCSVFKKENEDMVDFIEDHFPVKLVEMKVLKGYALKADTMFAAMFRKM